MPQSSQPYDKTGSTLESKSVVNRLISKFDSDFKENKISFTAFLALAISAKEELTKLNLVVNVTPR